jgi:putative nucleotidyltransferase with HDIG domain
LKIGGPALGHAARWAFLLLPAIAAGLPAPRPAILLLHAFFLSFFWLVLLFFRPESYRTMRELTFFALLFALTLGLGAVIARLAPEWPVLLPVPMAALLITLLYNGRLAMTAAAVLSLVLATASHTLALGALTFGLAGGVPAALSLRRVRRRSDQYRAVLAVAGGNLIGALVFGLAAKLPPPVTAQLAALGLGVAAALVATSMLVLPGAEALTRRTTDFTLLELADPTRPLLARLAREAPGTWAHSLVVANLCEAACNAIGANGLLARVGGFYHDVGKLAAPALFVENQNQDINPLSALPPRDSARAVRDHVSAGLALAAKAGLPSVVRDFIPEHHGTMALDYFVARLDPAEQADAAMQDDFRYPGPRPRSRETAVAMLADAAEAAVHVLEERSQERVREVVTHLIRQRLDAGQLSEAPLTVGDLERVTDAFVPLLAGIHHSRLDYPRSIGGITKDFGRE